MALAQVLGDVVNAAAIGPAGFVLALKAANETRDRLVDALDGHGRAALGRLQAGRDGVDGSTQSRPGLIAPGVGVVDAAAARAALVAVDRVRPTRQGDHALLLAAVLHDHGVQPLAQRHAGAAGEVLGDLARLGLDALYAPRRGCAH
jgi:hypothetical protein